MPLCKDCAFYEIHEVTNAQGRIEKNKVARCLWRQRYPWPKSLNPRSRMAFMFPFDDADCDVFIPREYDL